ncbi:MAG: lysoplasmalogenase [Treponema sp.]|nr:lysoplasmalogenase [Treponema sp.]
MIKIISFCLMTVSLAVLNIVSFFEMSQVLRVSIKTTTSIMFVITGFLAARSSKDSFSTYTKLILTGLILGMLGDILLALQYISIGFFVAGLISFALGHIFYVISFSLKSQKMDIITFLPMIIVLPLFLLLVCISKQFDFQGLFPCILIYGIILTFMEGKSLNLLKYTEKAKKFVILTITGTSLFAISDIILLFILFMNLQSSLKNVLGIFNLVTYYIGQGLIALSLTYESLAVRD